MPDQLAAARHGLGCLGDCAHCQRREVERLAAAAEARRTLAAAAAAHDARITPEAGFSSAIAAAAPLIAERFGV
jgi:hypothetical protein